MTRHEAKLATQKALGRVALREWVMQDVEKMCREFSPDPSWTRSQQREELEARTIACINDSIDRFFKHYPEVGVAEAHKILTKRRGI